MSSQSQSQDFPISFSQLEPDVHSSMAPKSANPTERSRLQSMDDTTRSRLITDVSRYILFKALSNDPIDRTKLAKEAFPENLQDGSTSRMTNACVEMANQRLQAVFSFEIQKIPDSLKQNKNITAKFSERLYVVNNIRDDEAGSHSKRLHGYYIPSTVEKGLLMLVLAFIYCKGEVKDGLRWLDAAVLYQLLHSVDENIPATPAADSTSDSRGIGNATRKRQSLGGITSPGAGAGGEASGVELTPNVDLALERFVHMDYLVKKKFEQQGNGGVMGDESPSYAIGPRALIVVGLRQIVHFCADVLEQQPDPTMLQELEQMEEREEQLAGQ